MGLRHIGTGPLPPDGTARLDVGLQRVGSPRTVESGQGSAVQGMLGVPRWGSMPRPCLMSPGVGSRWYKDGALLTAGSKYRMLSEPRSGLLVLVVRAAGKEDLGHYECEVRGGQGPHGQLSTGLKGKGPAIKMRALGTGLGSPGHCHPSSPTHHTMSGLAPLPHEVGPATCHCPHLLREALVFRLSGGWC